MKIQCTIYTKNIMYSLCILSIDIHENIMYALEHKIKQGQQA